jgi:non-ribosomal peptide synthetase component F
VNYATDLFDRETVKRWMACFTVLLRGMTEEVESRIGDLPILPESERHQVIKLFNATQMAFPQEKLIHELFEEQVRRMPDAVSVVHEGQSLTYAELNGRANQLARFLRKQGVGPDRLVAICVERSVEMVIGLLGVLKAGGAYVPLDVSYPAERLAYVLEDSAPVLLLTHERLKGILPASNTRVIALDADEDEIGREPDENSDAVKSQGRDGHASQCNELGSLALRDI